MKWLQIRTKLSESQFESQSSSFILDDLPACCNMINWTFSGGKSNGESEKDHFQIKRPFQSGQKSSWQRTNSLEVLPSSIDEKSVAHRWPHDQQVFSAHTSTQDIHKSEKKESVPLRAYFQNGDKECRHQT
jgi:hypothetical protein